MFFRKLFGLNSKRQTETLSSSEYLKQATKLKSEGKLDEAIQAIHKAHEVAASEGVVLASAAYLKLPQYLYLAKRNDEAWSVLNKMLSEGITGNRPDREMLFVEHSQVYREMSKQLKAEGRLADAAVYSVLSTVNWQRGMVEQNRHDSAKVDSEKQAVQIVKLLKSTNEESKQAFLSEAMSALEKSGDIEPSKVLRDLKVALSKN